MMDSHPPIFIEESADQAHISHHELPRVHAAHVYILMKKNIRVSRNIRACWFFRHLQRSISFTPLTSVEELTEDLTLVSVIPRASDVKLQRGQTYEVHIGPDTGVTFLSSQYRLSFTLDLSPSLMSVDVHTGNYVYEGVFLSLSRCLRGLVMPMLIPGSDVWYTPELFVSVVCHTPVICSFTNQVLVQGVRINQNNIDHYLKHLESELIQYEAALSGSFASLLSLCRRKESFFVDEEEEPATLEFNLQDHIGNPEAGFTNMLRYGILALQLLPDNSSSGIVVITDGIVGLPSSSMIELLLNQMRNNTIMCSFIKVGSPSGLYRKLSHVPHVELMQAISTATFGAYLGSAPDVSDEKNETNLYHRAMLFWSFQRGLEGFKYDLTYYSDEDMPGSIFWIKKMLYRHPVSFDSFGLETLWKDRDKKTLVAGIHSVISTRLREGYTIKNVHFKKDNTEIHVKLQFPWRDYGKIEYTASAAWPLEAAKAVTNVEVTIEGSYDLLHEMLCKPSNEQKSALRVNNIKTLWAILERIVSSDQILEHLQSFSSEPTFYQTPECIRSGVPLFYVQPEGPMINMQLKASTMDQFAAFWKVVIQLDTNSWQKWLHSHRIGLVLEHDRQFPKCFQVPNASSRFTSIQCRQALTSLSVLLREWSTFVLAENHSYIKFLQQEPDKPPKFFCVLRLTCKPPNMIIRLGFLGGTPTSLRLQELEVLREKIRNLRFPQRGTQKTQKKFSVSSSFQEGQKKNKTYKSPLNREGSEIACCVLLRKPVEKILVVYESKPRDMSVVTEPITSVSHHTHMDPMKSVFRTITHYLQHQRWVWNIQASCKNTISMNSISRILLTLTKLRLQEGFHFAVSGAGVNNLVLEVEMKEKEALDQDNTQTCVVQYIIFPPHTKTVDDTLSEDDQENDTTEADGEVQLITECWVEPQYGVCCNNSPERQHFNGLTYIDIARTFFPLDYECVSSLTTFDHLIYLCENSTIPSPEVMTSRHSSPPSTPRNQYKGKKEERYRSQPTVNFVSFPFDLQSLLPRCQQAEILFSTFFLSDGSTESPKVALDPKEPSELLLSLFYDGLKEANDNEILLSSDDCVRLVQHILSRPRDCDTHPVPFTYRPDVAEFQESGAFFGGHQGQSRNCCSETKPGSHATWKNQTEGFKYTGSAHHTGQQPHHTGQQSHHTGQQPHLETLRPGESQKIQRPLWKCYIRKDEVTEHLLLTFVPSSIDDLQLLHACPLTDDTPPDHGAEPPTVVAPSLSGQVVVTENRQKSEPAPVGDESRTSANYIASNRSSLSQIQPEAVLPEPPFKATASSVTSADLLNRDSKIEQVQEWVNTSTHTMKPVAREPMQMPVYTYSCQLRNVISSLVDRWTFSLPEDIFEDMTFKQDVSSDPISATNTGRAQSHGLDISTDDQDDRDSWKSSLDRRSTDSNSHTAELFSQHCQMITDQYFTAFVKGVFLSLIQGYFMAGQDVDAAINICDELQPLEMDMTSFLLASCSHLQHWVHRARLRDMSEEGGQVGLLFHKQHLVRFQGLDVRKDEDVPRVPSVLQLPSSCVEITAEEWAALSTASCHSSKEQALLKEELKIKFQETIGNFFKPVPTLPDFYFYHPSFIQPNSEDGLEGHVVSSEAVPEEDDVDVVDDDVIMSVHGEAPEDLFLGTPPDSKHDELSLEGNMSRESVECGPSPLFLHFTCTVKQKSNVQHASVRSVPLCFGQITASFEEALQTLDLLGFRVTFDINCMTLLKDVDQPSPRKSYVRLMSNTGQSNGGKDFQEELFGTTQSAGKILGEPFGHLSKPQQGALLALKEEIEAIMQEEIISALRQMYPVTSDALVYVADYIRHAALKSGSKTVKYQCINLQFVYGPDQSLNMFIEEFERQNLEGYKLTKEGDYYFLVVNKVLSHRLKFLLPLTKSDFPLSGHATRENADVLRDYEKYREERSYSLPCMFPPPPETVTSPRESLSLLNTPNNTYCDSGGTKHRPRSCSDAKSIHRHELAAASKEFDVRTVASQTLGQKQLDPLARKQLDTLAQKPLDLLAQKQLDQGPVQKQQNTDDSPSSQGQISDSSLKKSSSFAGLEDTQTRTRAPAVSTGSRSRHCSAPTCHASIVSRPSTLAQSPSIISSLESSSYEGFEGDVSDLELDETASMSDISSCYPDIPDFWLLMQINQDRVEIFFHSRKPVDCESPTNIQHQELYSVALINIFNVCRKVNQALLLKELNKTKMCNALLVPEADEDFTWTSRRSFRGRLPSDGGDNVEADDDSEDEQQGYLAASMDLVPGFFACPVVWQHFFTLHPRLKHGIQRGQPPIGVMALRSVLNKFVVTNRKNMFVIEELSSRNVFYLRLKELRRTLDDGDLDASLSDSAHFAQNKQVTRANSDTISVTSGLGMQDSKMQDVVELTVHGIEDVGKEIKDDLMKMLQNKLDDAVLDTICVMLSRNPQCKLKPDDISFIQKPRQEPVETLLLTIPGHCSMYLVALMFYLRQNLLQFLHPPNYVDSNPSCQFQDVFNNKWAAVPADKIYLYVRPQPSGGKGIATVSVRLVDGQGKEVKLLHCPCPTKNNIPAFADPADFEQFVQTAVHEKSPSRPGPTALIQFRMWECGNCDVKFLCEKLMAAAQHALCDIVMEFFMLTAPICSVPWSLMDMYAPGVSSLPASPTKVLSEIPERKPNMLSRKLSVDPPRSMTTSKSIFSSFLDLRQNTSAATETIAKFLDMKNAPATATGDHQTSAPMSANSKLSNGKENVSTDSNKLHTLQYENGDKGTLHPVFCSWMVPWMTFCHGIGVLSMSKAHLHFQSRFSIDFVMKELQQSIQSIAPDTSLKIFKVVKPGSSDSYGVVFTPCKTTTQHLHMNKVLDNMVASGRQVSTLAVGRNLEQWQSTVQHHQDVVPSFSARTQKTFRTGQKFMPQFGESDKIQENAGPRSAEKDFVPRQRLLVISCQGKEMTLLMYNWASDLLGQVEKTATRLVQWNNARCHILDSIIGQKMGLFHHWAFSDLQYLPSQNPYTQSIGEVDILIRHHAPSRDYQRRNSSISNKDRDQNFSRSIKRIVPFDQTLKNLHPPKLLEKLTCSAMSNPLTRHMSQPPQESKLFLRQGLVNIDKLGVERHSQPIYSHSTHSPLIGSRKEHEDKIPVSSVQDPVFQQGLHLHDTHKSFVDEEERKSKLYRFYLGWSQVNWKNNANPPIAEDNLVQLKRAGRLFHYCATPLVFSTSWRQNVVFKMTGRRAPTASSLPLVTSVVGSGLVTAAATATTPATPDRAQRTRSRHSSGASNISSRGKPGEELHRKGSEVGLGLLATRSKPEVEEEESWHLNLRQTFLKEYKQYLVSELGFIKLNMQPSLLKTKGQGVTAPGSTECTEGNKIGTINLQKTLTGGIILMELSFRQEFFCVQMFAVDCSQLGVMVNQQIHLIFVDECDKYKDLIHVHSFAHDFHLRYVMKYLSKQEDSVFPAGFDLDSFLVDFRHIYPYPPSFSRSCMLLDSMTLCDLPFPGNMLYEEHMLKQMSAQDMSVFRMGDKFALVKHEKLTLDWQQTEEGEEELSDTYDAGLIIIINNSSRSGSPDDHMKLALKYFTVLTRQRDCYPIRTLEKAFGEFRGTAPHSAGKPKLSGLEDSTGTQEQEDVGKPLPVRQHIGMRKEHVNYRGYSNLQQTVLLSSLSQQSRIGREKILEMVETSKQKCRRDYLWQRLLISHTDGNTDVEDSMENVRSPLTLYEFCELLKTVAISPLWNVDAQLAPLFHMPFSWYRGLALALASKYPDAHRCFSSPDRQIQYIIVLNANNLDMFAMLSLNASTEQADLCVVLKEPVLDQFKHSPDKPNLPLYSLQAHVEDFVNVCCGHVWSSMIL